MSRFERRSRRHVRPVVAHGYTLPLPSPGADSRALLLAHARGLGCTCTPDIHTCSRPGGGLVSHVRILHDDDCPLLESGGPARIPTRLP